MPGEPAPGGIPQGPRPAHLTPSQGPSAAIMNGEVPPEGGEGDDEDDFENALSLAAMEAELKPKVLATFDNIAAAYKKLRKQQDKKLELQVAGEQGSRQQQKAYDKLREEIIADVKSLSLNNNRIESLVEQLYAINKRLVGYEGQLMRLADSYSVLRQDFIDEYYGNELDKTWLDRVGKLAARVGRTSSRTSRARSRRCAPRSSISRPRPASRSPSSAASSGTSRRASARPGRRRRRWSRPTCVSSSRSPRSTPTAACSSST